MQKLRTSRNEKVGQKKINIIPAKNLTEECLAIHVRTYVCVQEGRLARLASLSSLGARCHCRVQYSCSCLCLCAGGGAPRSAPVVIVEFNIGVHVRVYVCVQGEIWHSKRQISQINVSVSQTSLESLLMCI